MIFLILSFYAKFFKLNLKIECINDPEYIRRINGVKEPLREVESSPSPANSSSSFSTVGVSLHSVTTPSSLSPSRVGSYNSSIITSNPNRAFSTSAPQSSKKHSQMKSL
jgi:hypothetical protein